MNARLFIAALLTVLSLGAHAQFSNTKGVITDATTGLQWLDLKYTYDLSFNDVTDQLDGGIFSGYRYATLDEVKQLFKDAYFWLDFFPYQDNDAVHLATNSMFFDVFTGVTGSNHTFDPEIVQGFTAGGGYHFPSWPDGVNLQFASGVGSSYSSSGYTSTAWTDATAPNTADHSIYYGSWLVKVTPPVPEPQTYALMLTGLLALVWCCGRTKRIASVPRYGASHT